ncbi:MAG: hypothetical protein MUD05_07735 [Candidatus Nanopelagicales bacterium]|jgi:hypothetical protein|nr:hypothetical protein [Candidatus Nanopelagicales bacterium]
MTEPVKRGRGQPKTTGRYATRAELESSIIGFYQMPKTTIPQVARICGVSVGTAHRIINDWTKKNPGDRNEQ